MALPKGFGSGGSGGASRADVEAMIGRRVENMVGIITLSYLGAFFAPRLELWWDIYTIHGHMHLQVVTMQ